MRRDPREVLEDALREVEQLPDLVAQKPKGRPLAWKLSSGVQQVRDAMRRIPTGYVREPTESDELNTFGVIVSEDELVAVLQWGLQAQLGYPEIRTFASHGFRSLREYVVCYGKNRDALVAFLDAFNA